MKDSLTVKISYAFLCARKMEWDPLKESTQLQKESHITSQKPKPEGRELRNDTIQCFNFKNKTLRLKQVA